MALRWPEPRVRMLAELALLITETPWALSRAHHARATEAGLGDDELLHALALAAYFGHLNRIADAVGVPLDYDVAQVAPHAEPATPRLARAPADVFVEGAAPALELATRPATATALEAWRDYVQTKAVPHAEIAAFVAELVGDGPPAVAGDPVVRRLVETVTLAPWQLDDDAFAELRAGGASDAAIFDLCATASAFGAFSRLRVALVALRR